jgi:hypothetical protein
LATGISLQIAVGFRRSIRPRFRKPILALAFSVMAFLTMPVACKSYWIDATVENDTGQAIHELEVDYPTASFGTNTLLPGAKMHYRIQIRGSGPVHVEYTGDDHKTWRQQGSDLAEHEQGQFTIRLMPQGKVEFLPKVDSAQ